MQLTGVVVTRLLATARRHYWVIGSSFKQAQHKTIINHAQMSTQGQDSLVQNIIKRLHPLGSGPLCDADKGRRLAASTSDNPDVQAYAGLRLMRPNTMRLRSSPGHLVDNTISAKMIGVVRTLQLSRPNDFLAVMHALAEIRSGEVLVVHTSGSTRAVAGGLFTTEAARRGCRGLVVDGPIRDVEDLACPTYSTFVSPYAGTVQMGQISCQLCVVAWQ